MDSNSTLLIYKQEKYLYQSLIIGLLSIFFAASLVLYLFWELEGAREQVIYWYIIFLAIFSLRFILYYFYQRATHDDPGDQKWIYLFVAAACINASVFSMVIFLVPENQILYFTYVLLLLGTIAIASITSLGVIKQAFFAYLFSLYIPVIFFFINNIDKLHSFHFYAYLAIAFVASGAALRFNKSMLSAFTMEIDNQKLTQSLNKEKNERLLIEEELRNKALELELLNENLEYKIKEKTSELESLAFYDTLTQLPNRRHFYDYLERTLTRNKITKEPFALFFIDLDEFKSINDTLGHDFGDILLTKVAARLRDSTRVDDFIARVSGDEFIVIVKSFLYKTKVADIAENIINKISEPYYISDTQTFISCSVGISFFPDDGENINTLVKYSDLAMYHAKTNGKNSFHFYNNELYEIEAKKFILATALKTAVKKNEIFLVYQPQLACRDNKMIGMEVLLRWNSDKFGAVPVNKFIPLAEQSNQILELEDFVLKTALTQVKFWNEQSGNNYQIAVNISAVHFQQKDFVQQIRSILTQLDFKPELLELELTESALMTNTNDNINKLFYLKSLGIKLSIDDFGTGYSSMSYLKQLPIDSLKIDKSFIDGIPGDKNNCAITKAVIELAHQFNLVTIAEGVENKHQLDFLVAAGCQLVQGYYFYKPLRADAIEKAFKLTSK